MSLLLVAALAHAGEGDGAYPTVKMSGVLFPYYAVDLTDGADLYNEFGIARAYLRADASIAQHVGARITLDADHMKPAELSSGEAVTYDTKYRVFLKHAYVEAKDLGPVRVRAGMVPTAYTAFFDDLWGNRYVAESFAKSVGVLDTADLGVSVAGSHGKGLVDWNAAVLNGEGYSKLEVDAGKAVQARITVDPLASMEKRALPITGFASYSAHPTDETATLTWAAATGFDMPRLFAWAEVLGTSTDDVSGMGWSVSLNPRLPKYAGLIVRYDEWDADTGTEGDGVGTLIAGVDKDFLEKVSLALTYERSMYESDAVTPGQGVVLHAQAGF